MSIMAANTQNRIGVRQHYTRKALGVYRSHNEAPPRSAQFTTRPLGGMGLVPADPVNEHILAYPWRAPGSLLPAGSAITAAGTPIYGGPVIRGGGGWMQPAPVSAASPPSNYPTGEPFVDSSGNTWNWSPSTGWQINAAANPAAPASPTLFRSPAAPAPAMQITPTPVTAALPTAAQSPAFVSGAATTAQPGTPVPLGWPTTQAYTDVNGNIWTYTPASGWQITGTTAAAQAAAAAAAAAATPAVSATSPGTTVTLDTASSTWSDITTWLQESTIISSVPNFWLVAGAGVVGLLLYGGGRRH